MLHELLQIFRSDNPLAKIAEDFSRMLKLTCEMTLTAGNIYFRKPVTPEERAQLYASDAEVNVLERSIRKHIVAHLSVHANTPNLPYCLLLMSLVKDVERIGDYTKNLSEVVDIYAGELPEDEVVSELREMRATIEKSFLAAAEVFVNSDRERALVLIAQGKDVARRADGLLARIARLDYDAGKITALVLGVRYYKRIGGHLLNLLSSVVMPLHKVDYYDEDEVRAHAGNTS